MPHPRGIYKFLCLLNDSNKDPDTFSLPRSFVSGVGGLPCPPSPTSHLYILWGILFRHIRCLCAVPTLLLRNTGRRGVCFVLRRKGGFRLSGGKRRSRKGLVTLSSWAHRRMSFDWVWWVGWVSGWVFFVRPVRGVGHGYSDSLGKDLDRFPCTRRTGPSVGNKEILDVWNIIWQVSNNVRWI